MFKYKSHFLQSFHLKNENILVHLFPKNYRLLIYACRIIEKLYSIFRSANVWTRLMAGGLIRDPLFRDFFSYIINVNVTLGLR